MGNVYECRDMCLIYMNMETYAGHVHIYLAGESAETQPEPYRNFAEQPDRTKGVLPAQQAKATCGAARKRGALSCCCAQLRAEMAKSGPGDTQISTFFNLDDDF